MSRDQLQRIMEALAHPKEFRDVRVLITEDNLITYGWISTRMELDPDQLCTYKPAPKKSKSTIGEPSAAVEGKLSAHPKKATSFGPLNRKKAAFFSKRPAPPKPAAPPTLLTTEEGIEIEEPSPEPLKRRRKSRTESELAPKIAHANPPPSGSEDVQTSRTRVALEFENS